MIRAKHEPSMGFAAWLWYRLVVRPRRLARIGRRDRRRHGEAAGVARRAHDVVRRWSAELRCVLAEGRLAREAPECHRLIDRARRIHRHIDRVRLVQIRAERRLGAGR